MPCIDYGKQRHEKFVCGVVLRINDMNYYVPVSSCKEKEKDNFVIFAKNGEPVSSLRFRFMFPVPDELVKMKDFKQEPDRAYRSLLAQEYIFCKKHQETIQQYALRTYKRVLMGKNPGLVKNSCDFELLEKKYREYKLMLDRQSRPLECIDEMISAAAKKAGPKHGSTAEKTTNKCNQPCL